MGIKEIITCDRCKINIDNYSYVLNRIKWSDIYHTGSLFYKYIDMKGSELLNKGYYCDECIKDLAFIIKRMFLK